MNVLLTCSGRRNYLVDYFKEILDESEKVYTVNSTLEASSMLVANGAFLAPPLYEDGYVDYLLDICERYQIKLLVSLFDMELPILARNKDRFQNIGVVVAVSSSDVIDICNDKIQTMNFTRELGLKVLFTTTNFREAISKVENGAIELPLFVKPRWGMGSIAMQQADTLQELKILFEKVKRDIEASYLTHYPDLDPEASVIIQQKAEGEEYGLDIVNDLNGNYVTTFVKRKLGMRSGETDGAVTEEVPKLLQLGEKIGRQLKHCGNLDIDVFFDSNEPTVLEMNARFGGGYPFSHLAGANLPRAYIAWSANKAAKPEDLTIEYGIKGFKSLTMLNYNNINLLD